MNKIKVLDLGSHAQVEAQAYAQAVLTLLTKELPNTTVFWGWQ